MALLYIATFYKAPVTYTLRFDTDTQAVVLTTTGGEPDPILGDEYLPAPPGTPITFFCTGTTEYRIISQVFIPFAQVVTFTNSTNCGYIEPPPPPEPPVDEAIYGTVYRGTFSNTEQGFYQEETGTLEAVAVFICDAHTLGASDTTYIEFECDGVPLLGDVEDADESIYTPVRATKYTFQFKSTNEVNAETFVSGEDTRWKVFITIKNQTVFQGFLVTDDLTEDFNFNPNTVSLTCVDALGLIRDVPFTLPDGTTPKYTEERKGNYKLIEYLAGALLTTGLRMDIVIADNWMEAANPGVCAWDAVYLNFKTFEGDQVGETENARSVIEKLLTDYAYLKQHTNRWWIRNIDEIENRLTTYHVFNYLGEFQETVTGIDLKRVIAQNPGYDIIEHIGDASTKMYRRPFKAVKETFNYNLPKEIVDNQDFSRGQWLSPVPVAGKTVEGKTYTGSAYALEDWTTYQGAFGSGVAASGTAFILRYFFEGQEVERFAELTSDTSEQQFIRSNPIPVHYKDRFTFSVDVRIDEARLLILGRPESLKFFIILEGDDGVTYWLDSFAAEQAEAKDIVLGPSNQPTTVWPAYTTSATGLDYSVQSTGSTDGMFITVKVDEKYTAIPVSGNLYICLPFVDNSWVDYQNLQFEYKPFINGGYAPHKGQQNSVTSALLAGYKAVRDEEVFVSDSPKRLFKGALQILNTDNKFVLAGKWYNGAVFPDGLPGDEFLHTRGRTQIFAIWNQHNREFHILDSTLQGLLTTTEITSNGLPDCVHEWVHQYDTPHTTNRRWLLLHYHMDFYTCEWTGYFVEVYKTDVSKVYTDTFDFKFLRN